MKDLLRHREVLLKARTEAQAHFNYYSNQIDCYSTEIASITDKINKAFPLDLLHKTDTIKTYLTWAKNQSFFDFDTRLKFAFFLGALGSSAKQLRSYTNENKNCLVLIHTVDSVEQAVIIPAMFFTNREKYIEIRKVIGR